MEWQRKSEKRYAAKHLAAENRVRFPLSAPKTKDRRKFKKGLRRSRFHRFGATFRKIVTFSQFRHGRKIDHDGQYFDQTGGILPFMLQ